VTSLREEKRRLDDRCKEKDKKIEELTAHNERYVEYLVVATARIRELEGQLAETAAGAQQGLRLLPQDDMSGRLSRG
jgi:chromosome segregation ATPase